VAVRRRSDGVSHRIKYTANAVGSLSIESPQSAKCLESGNPTMSIANPEMYRIYHNPSICAEQKIGLVSAKERVDRRIPTAFAGSVLRGTSDNATAGCDDQKLRPVSHQYIVCMSMRPFSLARFSAQR
jgi:hypothetical protein